MSETLQQNVDKQRQAEDVFKREGPRASLVPCSCGWTASYPRIERGTSSCQGGGWPGRTRIVCIGCTRSTGYRPTLEESVKAWEVVAL